MFSHWARKRVCKFLLKRLFGRIIRGDLDSEQFEVQLRSGTIQLNDLVLNTDYLNEQLADTLVTIKEGSVGSLTLNFPWNASPTEQCEIEVDELELVFAPLATDQTTGFKCKSTPVDDSTPGEAKGNGLEPDLSGLGAAGGCAYLGVNDGVRLIAKMVERVLLGLRVRVRNVIIAFEGQNPDKKGSHYSKDPRQKNNHFSHSMLVIRVEQVEYGLESPSVRQEPNSLEENFSSEVAMLLKVVRFSNATVEVLGVLPHNTEHASRSILSGRAAAGKIFGQPVPIVLGEPGLFSGCAQLSMPWKTGCMSIPKLNVEVSISPLKVQVSGYVLEQLLLLFHSLEKAKPSYAQSCVGGQSHNTYSHGSLDISAERPISLGGVSSHSFSQVYQGDLSGSAILPVTRFIPDWMMWAGNDTQKKEGLAAEADLEASVDEFFECFDGTRSTQASLAGSGLWTWTCSAFNAITAASSLASGSVLIPQDSARQVECDIKLKLHGISARLILEDVSQDWDLQFSDRKFGKESKNNTDFSRRPECQGAHSEKLSMLRCQQGWDLDLLDIVNENTCDLVPDASCMENGGVRGMEEKKEEGFLEACFSDIDVSLLVSDNHWQLKLTMEQVEVTSHLPETIEDARFGQVVAAGLLRKISCSNEPLQELLENALPVFPVSLCPVRNNGSCKNSSPAVTAGHPLQHDTFYIGGGNSNKKGASIRQTKNYLLRLLAAGLNPAVNMIIKWEFSSLVNDTENLKSYDHTHVQLQLQPTVLWLDAYSLSRLLKLLERGFTTSYKDACYVESNHVVGNYAHARNTVHVEVFIPCLRILACFPLVQELNLLKDHFLCMDLHASGSNTKTFPPFIDLKLCKDLKTDIQCPASDSVDLRFERGSFYLISSSESVDHMTFSSQKFLEISSQGHESACVDIRWNVESRGGVWIAQRVWDGISSQQKRGDGGNGVGGRNSEFAAVTYAQEVEEKNKCIRQDVIACSSVFIHATLPHISLDLLGCQHLFIFNLISLFMDSLLDDNGQVRSKSEAVVQGSEDCCPETENRGCQSAQTSILVDSNVVEITLHPRHHQAEERTQLEGKGNIPWDSLRFNVQKFQLLSVSKLGMIDSASYFWLHHEDGHACGFLEEARDRELLLLCCKSDTLGRGDGGGGNALAAGSTGIEVAYVAWPGRHGLEDELITATVRGGTFIAHGSRLDWLCDVMSFFSQSLDEGATRQFVLEHSYFQALETTLFSMELNALSKVRQDDVTTNINHTFFSLDLLDVALCYEPGYEATMAANVRARNLVQTQPGAAERSTSVETFSPVGCFLAAAAVRVSSHIIADTKSKEYDIWLRDVAMLLLDTTLKRSNILDYTPESLRQAGYVRVASEAVMEAIVRINSEESLQWEFESTNNQLRLDTCHDTAAALSRIVAQLQQLFSPEIEPSTVHMQARKGRQRTDEIFNESNLCGKSQMSMDGVPKLVNYDTVGMFASVLEDAFTLVRNTNTKAGSDLNLHGVSNDSNDLQAGRAELLDTFEYLDNGHDMQAALLAASSFIQFPSHPAGNIDVQMPCTQDAGLPSFIEDYYVSKNVEPHHSQSCSCEQSVESPAEDYTYVASGQDKVEGKGGWYEGDIPRVLENHILDVDERVEGERGRSDGLLKKKSGLGIDYPPSIGRIVLQDLNLHWRLYGGSDWPNTRIQEPTSLTNQEGRQLGVCLEVLLDGVNLLHDTFPETGLYASRLAVSIRDVQVYDCSKDAPWKKILGYHRMNSRPRESSAKAVKVELEAVRPDSLVPFEEYRLSLDLLPLRLHLDQRHLDFFIDFFPSNPPHLALQGHDSDEGRSSGSIATAKGVNTLVLEADEDALLPFFQICEMRPFTIRVDYVPRRVDLAALRRGNYVELLNLVSWKGIELHLKHVRAAGVHGWATLSGIVVGEWLEDISRNQVHKLIKGLSPIRPLLALGSGAAKLIVLPTVHYRRDHHLLRGMRKGAIAFLRSLSLEAVGLGVHLAAGAHEILLHAESALSGVTPSISLALERGGIVRRTSQPGDTREGLQQACESLTRGLERTSASLIGNPMKAYQRGAGARMAVASALRAAPGAALAPASAAAGAVHCALLGVRNGLDPERKRESEEKHLGSVPDA